MITSWCQNTDDMKRLGCMAGPIREMLTGRHVATMQFLWPVNFTDGGELPAGYVEQVSASTHRTRARTRSDERSHVRTCQFAPAGVGGVKQRQCR